MVEKRVVRSLLRWFAQNARDLPWRRTRDPYAIWVSEVMLQQTQVPTVIPFWEWWMRALPTVAALAKASPEKIHKLWEGLGYYTRVRNLQRAAKEVVAQHQGQVPSSFNALLALPGIGRYTAGAICSIAFDQPRPVLDGNVIRVLARLFGIRGDVGKAAVREQLWKLADRLVQQAANTRFSRPCASCNQALMELGAVICTARTVRCEICPLAALCVAREQGCVAELPAMAPRPCVTKRRFMAFVVARSGKLLVHQRPDGVVNGQLWEFPNVEVGFKERSPEDVARQLFGVSMSVGGSLGSLKHSITRYRITLEAYHAAPQAGLPPRAGVWVDRRKLKQLTFSSAHKKLLERVAREP